MWEKELKIIAGLGKLYPAFDNGAGYIIKYSENNDTNNYCALWVCWLCRFHLNQRIPTLENFIGSHEYWGWFRYKEHFGIK